MKKNTAGQKWRVFAFDRNTGEPKTGDSSNITAKIAKDWGAATAITDTNPAETEDGYYLFDLSQAETNADALDIYPESSTADVSVIGVPGHVETNFDTQTLLAVAPDYKPVVTPAGNTRAVDSDGNDLATTGQLDAALWAQTRFRMSIPEKVERPESGTIDYTFGISTFDRDGALADCDVTPTVHAYYQDGTSADAKLGAVTKIDGATGLYTFTFEVAAADPDYAHIRFVGAASQDGDPIGMTDYTQIVDDASPDFTADDRTKLETLATDYTTVRAAKLDNIDATVSSRLASADYSAASIAAAVWAYGSRTLTGFGTLVASVWSHATRTLTGSTLSLGPTASRSRTDGYYTCAQDGTIGLYRRILHWTGDDLQQADVTTITYSIFALSGDSNAPTRTAVEGHEDVSLTVADVLFDEVQSDEWASDYNFKHIPDINANAAFAEAGTDYLVEYTITPTSGQKIIERIRVSAK